MNTSRRGDRPDILLIMSDQHNRNFMGCAGEALVRTPHLDRLAAEGARFTAAYCPAPLCVPSRMSFMTARIPSANEVWNNHHILCPTVPTWAHVLSLAGYETTLIGRMHFEGPDQRHGFRHRPVGEPGAGPVGAPQPGGPRWSRFPPATSGQQRLGVETAGKGRTHYQWLDEDRTAFALRWLREKGADRQRPPFAAVLGYTLPHCPFIAPEKYFDYYYPRVEIPAVETAQPATVSRFRRIRGILDPPLPEERVRVARAAYHGLCEHLDALIGQVLAVLDETGLARNTLLIYTSDHGEMAGEHGCWWKSNYYEGSAGVPLLVRWPGVIGGGSRREAVCNLSDIGPTLAEIAGGRFSGPVDGRSLLRLMTGGEDEAWPGETFSELVDGRGGVMLASRMIRSGPWKLWAYADDAGLPPALFNLAEDPGETRDLSGDPAFAPVRERLMARLLDGWDPAANAARSAELVERYKFLAEWGRVTRPEAPDATVLPPADYEKGVRLV